MNILPKLSSNDPKIRNAGAMELIDFIAEVKKLIIKQIINKENENHRGTLVYALGHLNCSDQLDLLLDLILNGNYECFLEASSIIFQNNFPISDSQIDDIVHKLDDYISNIDSFPFSEEERKERLDIVKKIYDWF